ncbi:MAG: DNA mismatch endonuclease Vsr [Lewinellaceae bacterium]|nr:DNA mismatch endonuclease Vsr [Lewinellaceae bacterium]
MADTFSSKERSEIMRKVKSRRNRSTEIKLIEFFKENKIKGWRRNYKLYGKPDFVFPKLRLAVFTDGCFWHGHNCRNTQPDDNKEYWDAKIKKNRARDEQVNHTLVNKEWKVIRVWECELKKKNRDILRKKLSFLLEPPA